MPETQLSLSNQALTLIGAGPVSALTGTDARVVASQQLYEPVVGEVLGYHRWRFATVSTQLQFQSSNPDTGWESVFKRPSPGVPTDVLMVQGVYVNDYPIDFDIYADQIHCNALSTDIVVMAFTTRALESYWPVYFSACVRLKLAAAFAIAVAEDADKANVFEGKYVRQVAAARLADSQGHTAYKLPVGGFAAVVQGRP